MGKKVNSIDLLKDLKASNDLAYVSVGSVHDIELNKHVVNLEFVSENFLTFNGDQGNPDDFVRNNFVYILEKNRMHVLTISPNGTVTFPVSNLHGRCIYVLVYHYETQSLVTPKLTMNAKNSQGQNSTMEKEGRWTLVNRFINKGDEMCKLHKWLDHLNTVFYYDLNEGGVNTPVTPISNYGERLSGLLNLGLALELDIDDKFLVDEFKKASDVEFDSSEDEQEVETNNDSNFLYITEERITSCGLKVINKIGQNKIRFEAAYYTISGKFTTDDVQIFRRILNDVDTKLMIYNNFTLVVKTNTGLQDALTILRQSNDDTDNDSFVTKLSYEIHVSAMGGQTLKDILETIKNDNMNYLYGTTFRLYKWNKEVVKQLAEYNNGDLHHIRFDTGYNVDLLKTIKKYNDGTLKNVYFINSESDDNILVLGSQ